jgi:hypothetical protein
MVKQSARNDEIVRLGFDCILKNIDAADFKPRRSQLCDIRGIDVAGDYAATRRHAFRKSLRDRSVATAKFQAPPAWAHAKPGKASLLDRIQ